MTGDGLKGRVELGGSAARATCARTWANERGLPAPVFDLQSLSGEGALEDAGLPVDEMKSLSVMPCVVWRSLEMWRARDRRARHQDDVPLAFVVASGYLFMGVSVRHVALRVMRAKRWALALMAFR